LYNYIYVAILSHVQECNYRLRLAHVQWYNHAHVRFCGAHLGTRSRLHTLSQRGQWCGADSALQSKLRSQPTQKEHYYAYISNSSNLRLAIFLQVMTTCTRACYMRPHLFMREAYTVQIHIPSINQCTHNN